MNIRPYLCCLLICMAVCGAAVRAEGEKTVVCIIGTEHRPTAHINPQVLFSVLEAVGPDAVLCELEGQYFTAENSLDTLNFPDLLSTNENIAAHRYNTAYGVPLYPYEIEGRNRYYRQSDHFKKIEAMFAEFTLCYREESMSPPSRDEWKVLLDVIPVFDVFGDTLREINTPLKAAYSEAKNILTHHTLVSVARRDFPQWVATAVEAMEFWERRNDAMADNIAARSRDYRAGVVVVFCRQQHKAPLISRLRSREGIELREYWEFTN